ncbi:hypothetical protein [Halomicrobium katesii]|uniref:hypothetical protein n=1 Tax=Halomicrobium katesii TaxID=437163 RepID=UPI00036916AF|nr:hypothetical protein [Halomicrobium katesii]
MSEFADDVQAVFESAGADEATAATAAEKLAAFREEYDEELTADAVEQQFADAPDEAFVHAYDWLVGHLAAANDDCTDSREYRLEGFDSFAADPEIGA